MNSKKLSFILLLNLILIFLGLVIAYLSFIKERDVDTSGLESQIAKLDGEVQGIKVKIEDWEQIINGKDSIDIGKDTKKDDKKKSEPDKKQDKKDEPDDKVKKGEDNDEKDKKDEKAKTFQVTASALNLRDKPSINGALIKALSSGEKVTSNEEEVSADGHNWIKVTTSDGKTGWVTKQYLK